MFTGNASIGHNFHVWIFWGEISTRVVHNAKATCGVNVLMTFLTFAITPKRCPITYVSQVIFQFKSVPQETTVEFSEKSWNLLYRPVNGPNNMALHTPPLVRIQPVQNIKGRVP